MKEINKIELKHPIKTPNGEVKSITLSRMPSRKDYKDAGRMTADEEEKVWYMVCALSAEKLTIEDTDFLILSDCQQVIKIFREYSGLE